MDSNVIDHQQAVKEMMVERYLLNELGEQERDAFEVHLFECAECFEQVRAGNEFVHYIKRIGAEAEKPVATRAQSGGFWHGFMAGLRQPVAASAFALLFIAVALIVYQRSELSRQKGPALERSYMLTGIAHGGESAKPIQAPPGSVLSLNLEYTRRGDLTSYGVRILSSSGAVESDLLIPRDQVDGMARIAVSTDALKPGRHSVVVWGRNTEGIESEVGRAAFEFQFTQ